MENPRLQTAIKEATEIAYKSQLERIKLSNKLTAKFRKINGLQTLTEKDPIYGYETDPGTMETLVAAWKGENPKGKTQLTNKTLTEIAEYLRLLQEEEDYFQCVKSLVEGTKAYHAFLQKEKSVPLGVLGILTGWFNVGRAKYPSSFWNFAGLTPPQPKPQEEEKLTDLRALPQNTGSVHDPFVKAKLLGELGRALQADPKWNKVYKEYLTRKEKDKDNSARSRSHLHNMALRYTIKEFLKEYHIEWKKACGLEEPKIYTPR